ncbi:protein takeout-like [Photinus pyralis]|uniref:protein takeout-like n=1 Tax=Photinus pyralis TaxID=7054 RepID=UPI00126755B3|nr:protein takeout-like [Photinus pyralis]XP_031356561.1 protein takeout-like [Photinus pyralis]
MIGFITLVFALNIIFCNAQLITKFQVCSRSDPDINSCLKSAILNALPVLKDGVTEYGLPSLEPFTLPKFVINAVPPTHFDQVYTNIKVYGFVFSQIEEVTAQITDDSFLIVIKALTGKVQVTSDYEFEGALFGGVDASSAGQCSVNIVNKSMTVKFSGSPQTVGGERYLEAKDIKIIDIKDEKVTFTFTSQDKPEAASLLTKKFDEHWEAISMDEIQKAVGIYSAAFLKEANVVFSKIPFDTLFPK